MSFFYVDGYDMTDLWRDSAIESDKKIAKLQATVQALAAENARLVTDMGSYKAEIRVLKRMLEEVDINGNPVRATIQRATGETYDAP